MLGPYLNCPTFLLSSFLLVCEALPVSSIRLQVQSLQLTFYLTFVCFSGSGLSFSDGNCCSKVRAVSSWLWCWAIFSSLFMGSVELLM